MAIGINAPFVMAEKDVKAFLEKSAKSTAFEDAMERARRNIPDFDSKRVDRMR